MTYPHIDPDFKREEPETCDHVRYETHHTMLGATAVRVRTCIDCMATLDPDDDDVPVSSAP